MAALHSIAMFIGGPGATLWAAYHSNREDIIPLAAFAAAIATFTTAVIALMRHFAQTDADRQRRIVESFSKAVEQLGSDKLELRVGAIFALERISRENPDDYLTILEVLAAFVRERMKYETIRTRLSERAYFLWLQADRAEGRSEEFWFEAVRLERLEETPTDIAAIFTVIARRSAENRQREEDRKWGFDLRGTYLGKAPLQGVHLKRANLFEAHLQAANLSKARLRLANLSKAHLQDANLSGAHLQEAYLTDAHLERASISEAHLEGATLLRVRLEGAYLIKARLDGAVLAGADLKGVDLSNAHLEGADLTLVESLTDDQLLKSHGDGKTKLPKGVTRPTTWPPLDEIEVK